MSTPQGWRRLFLGEMGVRSGWRILLFATLFLFILLLLSPLAYLAVRLGIGALIVQVTLSLAAALSAGWILLRWLERRPLGALGFAWTPATPRELWLGLLIGVVSIGVVILALTLIGWVSYRSGLGTIGNHLRSVGGALIFFFIAAAVEEALFRGYPFQVLVRGIGAIPATLISSLAFSVAHLGNPNIGFLALINIFLAGVMLAAAYLRTRSLWFATTVHLGWNWAMASIFGLPVSGLEELRPPLYEAVVAGPGWVTGGPFGPEGGVIGTVGVVIALVAILRLPGIREAEEMRELRPLVDDRLGWMG